MSPQIITGALTGWTFDSSIKISFTFSHTIRKSRSVKGLPSLRISKH